MQISTDSESQRFYKFLKEENNNNIIFSGIYGSGKSFFLNDFFNNNKKEEYIPVFLTPVNYTVANNEDIFEYIKADILLQLLEKVPCDLINTKISMSIATYYYIKNNLRSLIGNILASAEKVYFKTDIIKQLVKLKNNINNFQEEYSISEDKEVESFIKEFTSQKGSIYEKNIITQIIQTLITNTKENSQKEVVLIIDDLDRIDPEHIFRILNILSAHNDFYHTKEHKFKFDKTILVCDIENIRKIFYAKYGKDVDFTGYIDKFYSKEIYCFNNESEIIKCIYDQVRKISSDVYINNPQNHIFNEIVSILSYLIKYKRINIRTLEKLEFNYEIGSKSYKYNDISFFVKTSPALIIFEILERIFGSPESLKSTLLQISESHNSVAENKLLDIFITLADLRNNHLKINKDLNGLNYKGIIYNILNKDIVYLTATINYPKSISKGKINQFEILYEAYINYKTLFE